MSNTNSKIVQTLPSKTQIATQQQNQVLRRARGDQAKTNIVQVSPLRPVSFYIYLVKELINHEKFEVIEVHSLGDDSINHSLKVIDTLTRLNYVVITRLKTKSIQHGGGSNEKTIKLICVLSKTPEFVRLYDEF